MQKINSQFRHGSGAYKCVNCGKMTRETGDGESSVELCKQCYFEGGIENQHTDYAHPGRMADCKECQAQFKNVGYELGTHDRWCDNPDIPQEEKCKECGAELSSGHYLICSQYED